ncbi:hypothetical protein WJX74_005168 [Apatococcus lobatus]|uniref:Uncharacterized protein n=1 Tax=Apatococcus lobatus TaxID=904363 RepID=A0AAW1QNB3_9CHLO
MIDSTAVQTMHLTNCCIQIGGQPFHWLYHNLAQPEDACAFPESKSSSSPLEGIGGVKQQLEEIDVHPQKPLDPCQSVDFDWTSGGSAGCDLDT